MVYAEQKSKQPYIPGLNYADTKPRKQPVVVDKEPGVVSEAPAPWVSKPPPVQSQIPTTPTLLPQYVDCNLPKHFIRV